MFLARQGFTVFALDDALNALQTTRQGLQAGSHSARLTGGDVGDLPYADASFDAIVSLFVIHHNRLARIRRAVEELRRVLKPGGLAVLDLNSTVSWNLGSETGIEVEPGTFMPTAGNEMGTPHRYFDEGAAREVFSCLHTLDFYLNEQDFRDSTGVIRHYGQWTAVVTR